MKTTDMSLRYKVIGKNREGQSQTFAPAEIIDTTDSLREAERMAREVAGDYSVVEVVDSKPSALFGAPSVWEVA